MRSGHSQWSSEASRNCLAADLYLVDINNIIKFWQIGEVGESSISIFEHIPKGICVLNSLPSHEVCQTPGTLQPCHQHHMLLIMIMHKYVLEYLEVQNWSQQLPHSWRCSQSGLALPRLCWRSSSHGTSSREKTTFKKLKEKKSHFYFPITWDQFWGMGNF